MRTDGNLHCSGFQRAKPFLRNPQLWGRAPPKQIAWSCWNDQKVWIDRRYPLLYTPEIKGLGMCIDQESLMPGNLDLIKCEKEFERIMWFLASEIDGPPKVPGWIYKCKLHDAISRTAAGNLLAGTLNGVGENRDWFSSYQRHMSCTV